MLTAFFVDCHFPGKVVILRFLSAFAVMNVTALGIAGPRPCFTLSIVGAVGTAQLFSVGRFMILSVDIPRHIFVNF